MIVSHSLHSLPTSVESAEVLRTGGDAAVQALTVTRSGVIMATDNESFLSVFVESRLIERRKLSGTVSCLNVVSLLRKQFYYYLIENLIIQHFFVIQTVHKFSSTTDNEFARLCRRS